MEKSKYEASVIEDSLSPNGSRLTTMQLRLPRLILAEITRHRSFSFSVGSSRARPFKRQRDLISCPIIFWGKQRAGMSATEEIKNPALAELIWNYAAYCAIFFGWLLNKLGVHKQITNRLIEPFIFVDVVMTGTGEAWLHLFALRIEKTAQPEIQYITRLAARAYRDSKPKKLISGEWHLPYISDEEKDNVKYGTLFQRLVKASSARCARTSYKNHDGTRCNLDKDVELYDRLLKDLHLSPLEHVARATAFRAHGPQCGNFPGWIQHRKEVEPSQFLPFDWGVLDGRDYEV